MNKKGLVTRVAAATGLTKVGAQQAVDTIFTCIADCLARGENLHCVGFGTFGVKKRAARNGINPRTRERMTIKATKVPYFTAGKKLAGKVK